MVAEIAPGPAISGVASGKTATWHRGGDDRRPQRGGASFARIRTVDYDIVPHWPSLVAILVGIGVTTTQNSHYGRIVAVLAFMFWAGRDDRRLRHRV